MILATDTDYSEAGARTAGVLFRSWADAEPAATRVIETTEVAAYEPGAFFRRELPLILALLEALDEPPSMVVVDGYVTLDGAGRKGLGAHLFDALAGAVGVIGVAKTAFQGSPHAVPVIRGTSERPLYVTAVGLAPEEAAEHIRAMHGPHRLPTLLKWVDRLCRDGP